MKRPRKPSPGDSPLQRRVKVRLNKPAPAKAPPRTEEDPQRFLHDLQVRQVELETRNEELRRALAETRAALKEEQARIRSYLDVAEVMIVVIEAGQRTALVNRKTCEVLGYKEAELVGKNWFDTVLPEAGRDRIKGAFEDLIAGRVEPWKYVESPARTRLGKERLIAWHNTVLRDASGAIVATLSSGEDITESKRTEESLRVSKERYRTLFDESRDGIALADAKTGTVVDCNPALCQMLERDKAELLGQPQSILHPPQRIVGGESQSFRQHRAGHAGQPLEDIVLSKSGTLIPVEIRASRVEIEGRSCLLGVFRDITERRRAEEVLRRSEEQLHALSARLQAIREEERASIAREIHDELGQTLTAAKMDVAWIEKHLPAADLPAVEPLRKKTESLLALIDAQIRTVQRIASDLRPGLLDDLGLVSTLRWYAGQFRERTGLRVDLDLPPEDVALEAARATAAFRICQEAFTNAARHARAAAVSVRLRATPERLTMEVRDDGRGITPLETGSPKSLGLLGMRERVLPWGGTVDIRGEEGKGTTVTVTIPLV